MGVILGFGMEAITVGGITLGAGFIAFSLLLKEWQSRSRRPFSGRPLRPPGETLRVKLDQLSEQLLLRMGVLVVILVPTVTISESAFKVGNPNLAIGVSALGIAAMLGLVIWVWRFALRMSHYALGFDGERAVGATILLRLGPCRSFNGLVACAHAKGIRTGAGFEETFSK